MKEIEFINSMISLLKDIKSDINKREKLMVKTSEMATSLQDYTPNSISKVNTQLNFLCMDISKKKAFFTNKFRNSILEEDDTTYCPSGFHKFGK